MTVHQSITNLISELDNMQSFLSSTRVQHRPIGVMPDITPPTHVKSLTEEAKLDDRISPTQHLALFRKAIADWRDNRFSTWDHWKHHVSTIGRTNK